MSLCHRLTISANHQKPYNMVIGNDFFGIFVRKWLPSLTLFGKSSMVNSFGDLAGLFGKYVET